jgi:hypothetical protein
LVTHHGIRHGWLRQDAAEHGIKAEHIQQAVAQRQETSIVAEVLLDHTVIDWYILPIGSMHDIYIYGYKDPINIPLFC